MIVCGPRIELVEGYPAGDAAALSMYGHKHRVTVRAGREPFAPLLGRPPRRLECRDAVLDSLVIDTSNRRSILGCRQPHSKVRHVFTLSSLYGDRLDRHIR